jgi:hypothetical protein
VANQGKSAFFNFFALLLLCSSCCAVRARRKLSTLVTVWFGGMPFLLDRLKERNERLRFSGYYQKNAVPQVDVPKHDALWDGRRRGAQSWPQDFVAAGAVKQQPEEGHYEQAFATLRYPQQYKEQRGHALPPMKVMTDGNGVIDGMGDAIMEAYHLYKVAKATEEVNISSLTSLVHAKLASLQLEHYCDNIQPFCPRIGARAMKELKRQRHNGHRDQDSINAAGMEKWATEKMGMLRMQQQMRFSTNPETAGNLLQPRLKKQPAFAATTLDDGTRGLERHELVMDNIGNGRKENTGANVRVSMISNRASPGAEKWTIQEDVSTQNAANISGSMEKEFSRDSIFDSKYDDPQENESRISGREDGDDIVTINNTNTSSGNDNTTPVNVNDEVEDDDESRDSIFDSKYDNRDNDLQ